MVLVLFRSLLSNKASFLYNLYFLTYIQYLQVADIYKERY